MSKIFIKQPDGSFKEYDSAGTVPDGATVKVGFMDSAGQVVSDEAALVAGIDKLEGEVMDLRAKCNGSNGFDHYAAIQLGDKEDLLFAMRHQLRELGDKAKNSDYQQGLKDAQAASVEQAYNGYSAGLEDAWKAQ